jgi:invasion protein IalB
MMKRFALAAALVAATAAGAFAQQSSVPLSSAISTQIMAWVPNADLSNLTNAQYAQIVSLFANSDNLRTGNDPVGQVKVILNAQ